MSAELQVHYLSQNRGPAMGMGLYERLLLKYLLNYCKPKELSADITFDGRKQPVTSETNSLPSGLQRLKSLGFSTAHLSSLPWNFVKCITGALLPAGGRKTTLFHSLALSFPASPRLPAIYTIHDLPPTKFADEGILPSWSKSAANEAQAIITPSEFGKSVILEHLGVDASKVHVVLNGCEHDLFNPQVKPLSEAELKSLGLPFDFLFYAGGATRRKNVIALLEAWLSICADFPDLYLVLAGPKEKLKENVAEVGAPRVVVQGYVDHAVMPRMMKASRAVVCPSIYEGFGLPPLEAMALGIPTIGTKVAGAVPEVMADAGVLAEDGSPEALAAAIRGLLLDQELAEKLKDLGPKRALQFSWTEHAKQVLMIYRNVLSSSQ